MVKIRLTKRIIEGDISDLVEDVDSLESKGHYTIKESIAVWTEADMFGPDGKTTINLANAVSDPKKDFLSLMDDYLKEQNQYISNAQIKKGFFRYVIKGELYKEKSN